MQRTISIGVVALLLLALVPTVDAETINAGYDIPSGATRLNPTTGCSVATCGPGLSTRVCHSAWDDWDEGVFSNSGDNTVFGPAGFTPDNNPDDTLGETAMTPAFSTGCGTARLAFGDDGVTMGVFGLLSACGDCYTDFAVSVTDTLPTSTYYSFCLITQHQDDRGYGDSWCGEDPDCSKGIDPATCDDIEDARVAGCGSVTVTTAVPAGGPVNRATAFVYASHVNEITGAVCLGSKGTLTVEMT